MYLTIYFFSFQRPLLFQTSEDIVCNPALGESLPHSVVLHHLFSRAPNELKSPHEVCSPACQRQLCFMKLVNGFFLDLTSPYYTDKFHSISQSCASLEAAKTTDF